MTVIVLTAVPDGLRGHLTKWMMEVAPGVFVGQINARIREGLWRIVQEMIGSGRALMVFSARNEQGMEIRNLGHSWEPIDFDGITLMRRPSALVVTDEKPKSRTARAARYRRARRYE